MSKDSTEYLSLASLIEYEEMIVSRIPAELIPEDDRESESFYSLRVWRPSGKEFIDTLRWRDRFRAIFAIILTGRFSQNSFVLSRDQILKLSSWIYNQHPDEDPVLSRD